MGDAGRLDIMLRRHLGDVMCGGFTFDGRIGCKYQFPDITVRQFLFEQVETKFVRADTVQRREVPEEVPEVSVALGPQGDAGLLDVMRKAFGIRSNGEARRLVTQKAVWKDGELVTDPSCRLGAGTFLLRAGKRRYAKVELREDA